VNPSKDKITTHLCLTFINAIYLEQLSLSGSEKKTVLKLTTLFLDMGKIPFLDYLTLNFSTLSIERYYCSVF
tara:strand:+ start:32 stop:247 length:216 start_codon:yes stop_codon:yes gene_type:complete